MLASRSKDSLFPYLPFPWIQFFLFCASSKSLVRKHDCLNIALFVFFLLSFFLPATRLLLCPVGLIAEVHSTKGENQMLRTNIRAGFSLWLTFNDQAFKRHSSYRKLKMFQSIVRQFMTGSRDWDPFKLEMSY
jgi:hypothetical protein